jgi:hypothetical protein
MVKANDLVAVVRRTQNNGANRGVKTRTIPAAGEQTNTHELSDQRLSPVLPRSRNAL